MSVLSVEYFKLILEEDFEEKLFGCQLITRRNSLCDCCMFLEGTDIMS